MKFWQPMRVLCALIYLLLIATIGTACTSPRSSSGQGGQGGQGGESEESISLAAHGDWLPIIEPAPINPGDIRNLPNCAEESFKPPLRGPWSGIENKKLAAGSQAHHSAFDTLARVGEAAMVQAHFSYGEEPLKNEWVRLYLRSCSEWAQISVLKTDEFGRASYLLPQRLQAGVYSVIFQVVGDATTVRSELWVLPSETKIIAMELDGAVLQNSAHDKIEQTLPATRRNFVRGAADLAAFYARRGHLVVYLAGDLAPSISSSSLRHSLRKNGFPVGPFMQISPSSTKPPRPSLEVARVFAADTSLTLALERAGIHAEETLFRRQFCRSLGSGARSGWTRLITQLRHELEAESLK